MEPAKMSSTIDRPEASELGQELAALRRNWLWFVLLGVALIVVGFIALGSLALASLATAVALGALLLVAGLAEAIGAIWCRGWNGVFLHLLSGVLSIVVGLFFLTEPVVALRVLTLLLACLLIVGGAFKITAVAMYRFEAWGWPLLSGIIDLVLGMMIWLEWPTSALWVLGLFVGISLVFRGFNWIGLGLLLRSRPIRPGQE
jgi:uncharacterized membrane protein HdeD (DUF308 family)